METTLKLFFIPTDTDLTLYWDKPEGIPANAPYTICCDGKETGTTGRTHYRITGLEPESTHTLQVRSSMGDSEVFTVTQKPEAPRIDVTKEPYLARGDGKTVNTRALQEAILDCPPGSCVYIPAGVYLTGALDLHSDMELYLEEGAVLQGTTNPEDYLPRIWSRFEGLEMKCYSSLLNLGYLPDNHNRARVYVCKNVIIRGGGTIAGGGRKLAEGVIAEERERLKETLERMKDRMHEYEKPETIPGRYRPRLLNMSRCRNVILDGLTLKNGPSWNVHMIYSDQILTHHCTFQSKGIWNGDGWDPDSSTNCTIFDCVFDTGDDSIAVKSGKNPEGNRINRPTENVRIFDCTSLGGHGITMGSEISGGISDVSVWDCDLEHSLCGLEIKGTRKRGGYVKNIRVRDCTAPRIMVHSVGYNDDGDPAPTPPVFSDLSFENITLTCRTVDEEGREETCPAIQVEGFEDPGYEARNIHFKDIRLSPGEGQIQLKNCKNVTVEGISS